MKTAEEIVMALAMREEPYYIVDDECYCALCPTKGGEADRVPLLGIDKENSEDGLSVMGHVSGCAWRQAVDYAIDHGAGE